MREHKANTSYIIALDKREKQAKDIHCTAYKTNKALYGHFPGSAAVKTPHFHLRGAWVQSLVEELKSHMPDGTTKKGKNNPPKLAI